MYSKSSYAISRPIVNDDDSELVINANQSYLFIIEFDLIRPNQMDD